MGSNTIAAAMLGGFECYSRVGAGNEVTVTYDSHGTAKVATRIEVKPKK